MDQANVLPFQTGFGLTDFQQLTKLSGIGFSEKSENEDRVPKNRTRAKARDYMSGV